MSKTKLPTFATVANVVLIGLLTATPAQANPALPDRSTLVPRLGLAAADGAISRELAAADAFRERIVSLALARHPALSAEAARLTAADAAVDAARAVYQPEIALDAGLSRSASRDLDLDSTRTSLDRELGVSLRENLWRGGRDALDVDIAGDERTLVRLTREERAAQVRYDVERALLAYNQAAMEEGLGLASAADAATLRRISERKFAAGQVGKIDVHSATMRESEARAQTVTARLQRSSAWYGVLRAIGGGALPGEALPVEEEALALARVALPFPANAPVLRAGAKPTFGQAQAETTAAKAEKTLTKAYRSRFLPQIDFVLSAKRSFGATDVQGAPLGAPDGTESKVFGSRIALELSWPLWARPRDHAVARAAAEVDVFKAKAEEARRGATLVAEELMRRVAELYAALPPYGDAYAQAEKLYDAQVKLYDAGAVELAQVTEADGQKARSLRSWYGATQEIRAALLRWQALQTGYQPP